MNIKTLKNTGLTLIAGLGLSMASLFEANGQTQTAPSSFGELCGLPKPKNGFMLIKSEKKPNSELAQFTYGHVENDKAQIVKFSLHDANHDKKYNIESELDSVSVTERPAIDFGGTEICSYKNGKFIYTRPYNNTAREVTAHRFDINAFFNNAKNVVFSPAINKTPRLIPPIFAPSNRN